MNARPLVTAVATPWPHKHHFWSRTSHGFEIALTLPDGHPGVTLACSAAQVEPMVREYVVCTLDVAADSFDVEIEWAQTLAKSETETCTKSDSDS